MQNVNRIMFTAVLLTTAFLSALCNAKEPVYIGLSAPMTGQYAETGKSFQEGVELVIEKINKAGGIDGRLIELLVGDSQGEPKIAKRVARRFTENQSVVAEIGDFTSSCSLAAQPIYHKAGMVQLSPTASHPSFVPGSPYSLSLYGTQANTDAPFMARMAVEKLGKKRLAVAYLNTDWGVVTKKFFIEKAKQLGAEIVAEEPYFDGTSDFSTVIEKIRKVKPDVLFLSSMTPDAAGICRQIMKSGWNEVVVIGAITIYTPEFIKLAGNAAENVILSSMFFSKNPKANVQNFVTAYRKSYNRIPDWFAAIAYDSMTLLTDAIKKGNPDRKTIYENLMGIKEFSGATGEITFGAHKQVLREYQLLHVKNGEFVLY